MNPKFKNMAICIFLLWLFIATFVYYKVQSKHLAYEKIKDSFIADKYIFGSFKAGEVTIPILLNTNTGESWRYFQDMDKKIQGWSPIPFYEVKKESD